MARIGYICAPCVLASAIALALANGPAHAEKRSGVAGAPLAKPVTLRRVQVGAPSEVGKTKIVEVDRESREVVVAGPKGVRIPITVPASVKRVERLEVGGEISITYYASVALAIRSVSGALPATRIEKTVLLVPQAGTARRVVAEVVERVGVLRSVDAEPRRVMLEVPAGDLVALRVDDAIDLRKLDIGEKVVATHTEAIAITLVFPQPADSG